MTERIGEIIKTNSFLFAAESFALNRPPALGSLVKAQTGPGAWTFGVVAFGETVAVDPGRQPMRHSKPDAYDDAVYAQHPELAHLLRTTFTVVPVGGLEDGLVSQRLPVHPPPMHFSVYDCEQSEVLAFSEKLLYLRTLAAAQTDAPMEQVLAANLRWTYDVRGGDEDWLRRAALEVASLLQQDVERLLGVLYAVDPEA
jgi:hypothetical protein